MPSIPRRTLVSSIAAPLFLGSGCCIAAALQPRNYSSVRDTISALAGLGANDRWVMTTALAGLGICHIVTASGLQSVERTGRAVLGIGGVGTILVATFPQPVSGNSVAHTIVASIAFTALGIWPIVGSQKTADIRAVRRPTAAVASTIMIGLSAWFAFQSANPDRGLIERAAAGTQALWPLLVVLATLRANKRLHPMTENEITE